MGCRKVLWKFPLWYQFIWSDILSKSRFTELYDVMYFVKLNQYWFVHHNPAPTVVDFCRWCGKVGCSIPSNDRHNKSLNQVVTIPLPKGGWQVSSQVTLKTYMYIRCTCITVSAATKELSAQWPGSAPIIHVGLNLQPFQGNGAVSISVKIVERNENNNLPTNAKILKIIFLSSIF